MTRMIVGSQHFVLAKRKRNAATIFKGHGQSDNFRPQRPARIVVAVDSSTAGSFEICRSLLKEHGRALVLNAECVGIARAAAAGVLLTAFSGLLDKCWPINIDADCVVLEDRLIRRLHHANNGVNAVAGIVDVDDSPNICHTCKQGLAKCI